MGRLRGIDKEWLKKQLYLAFLEARKNKLGTSDEFNFEMYWPENIERLADDIINRQYKPSRGIAFIVNKPVKREIFAAPFRDRVVHHFLYDNVVPFWDKRFIYNSFSCRVGKGTFFGVKRLQKDILSVSKNYTERAYVMKFDIQGYFMSLSREKLFERADWGLKRQFANDRPMYELLRFLWGRVIFDDPVAGVKKRPPFSGWNTLPDNKSLFKQLPGYGIVIGNLSSQLLSNIYLDQLDRFITMQLGYKHYGRYVDDFYMVVAEKDFAQAKRDILAIEEFLANIGLVLHPNKRYIQEVRHGVTFLGVTILPGKIVAGKRFKNSFYQVVRKFEMGLADETAVTSMLGYCKNINGKNLCRKVFDSVGWEYQA